MGFRGRSWVRNFCLFGLLISTRGIFAAPPIQGGSLKGAAAADARLKLISTAESFLGTPYLYSGLSRNGMDCSGLVYTSFREALNATIPRSSESIYSWVEKISTNELQPGDLVFFITSGRNISHLGIYTGGGRFIHSASEGPQTGVMYSRLDESYWKRTYHGAGRALPWDAETAMAMPSARADNYTANTSDSYSGGTYSSSGARASGSTAAWADSGIFTGVGVTWTWGGFIEGAPSVFRGFSSLLTMGYKWTQYRVGLELRPGWDRALGVFRLPVTLSIGTEFVQFFAGPALTLGKPSFSFSESERNYTGGGEWRWELGFSFSLPLIKIQSGALAVYGETAWQPYHWGEGEQFSFKPDFTANFRLSTGFRYLWRL